MSALKKVPLGDNGRRGRQRDVNIFVAVVLIALLGFLFNKTRGVDFDEHNEIISNLRQLKQIDAE